MKRTFAVLTFLVLTISMAAAQRLPEIARPENYKLTFNPDMETAKFEGDETISLRVLKPTSDITLNAADIDFHDVTITSGGATQKAKVTAEKEKEMVVLSVDKPLAAGPATMHITLHRHPQQRDARSLSWKRRSGTQVRLHAIRIH